MVSSFVRFYLRIRQERRSLITVKPSRTLLFDFVDLTSSGYWKDRKTPNSATVALTILDMVLGVSF